MFQDFPRRLPMYQWLSFIDFFCAHANELIVEEISTSKEQKREILQNEDLRPRQCDHIWTDIGSDCPQIGQSGNPRDKMYWNLIWKVPGLSYYGPIWPNLAPHLTCLYLKSTFSMASVTSFMTDNIFLMDWYSSLKFSRLLLHELSASSSAGEKVQT